MSTMTRRIAIVGLSWIAADDAAPASDPTLGTAMPYSHASAVAALPGLEIVAGCDIAEVARTAFLERWGPRYPGLEVYADYREMLAAQQAELVSVVTPDHLHREVVEAAIENGARGIFCEKPIATTLADADAIVAAVRAAGVTMNVNYTRRWYPEFVEARRLVRDGDDRPPVADRARDGRSHGRCCSATTPTAIDIVNFLADSKPTWVWAELERGFEDYGTAYAGDGGNDPASEPGANYYIAYENGVRAYLTGDEGHRRDRHRRPRSPVARVGSSSTSSGHPPPRASSNEDTRTQPGVASDPADHPALVDGRDAGRARRT